jgi:uncharacterized damage-inducible protein DinB
MGIKKIIINYTRYNHWANEKMVQWLQTLDTALLYKETASSYNSIDLTVQHMNRAQNYWIAVITEDDIRRLDESVKYNDVDNTLRNLPAGSKRMLDIFGAYPEEELTQKLFTGDMVQERYEFILHCLNHNTYHRGQIITMSRCLGITDNIPAMDYDVFLWARNR